MPRGSKRPPGINFEAILDPFWTHVGFIWTPFGLDFGRLWHHVGFFAVPNFCLASSCTLLLLLQACCLRGGRFRGRMPPVRSGHRADLSAKAAAVTEGMWASTWLLTFASLMTSFTKASSKASQLLYQYTGIDPYIPSHRLHPTAAGPLAGSINIDKN